MGPVRYFLPLAVGFVGSLPVLAQIDSGGSIKIFEGGTNHSSVGAPFASGVSASGLIEILYPPIFSVDLKADSDGNGLPDIWEIEHFGEIGADPLADSDGDGTTNLMEYLAGTAPNDHSSVFRPFSDVVDGNLVLSVPTVSNRNYRVWGTANLEVDWTLLETIKGDGSVIEWMYSMSQSNRYFLRIEILIPKTE